MVSMTENEFCGLVVPRRDVGDLLEHKKEGYRICVRRDNRDTPVVWIIGGDARANSYDAWNAATYEQYIRDLILFDCNCIENIPFQND